MGPLGTRIYADTLAAIRDHKRRFWQYMAQYEKAGPAWEKQWFLDLLMSERRMMKSCLNTAKEIKHG